jgi:hypothetical protein
MAKINRPDSTPTEPDATPEVKAPRIAVGPGGIPREVERSFYDVRQDCVIDVLRIPKVVQNRRGEDQEVVIYRHVYCKDENIQAKYQRGNAKQVEVTE